MSTYANKGHLAAGSKTKMSPNLIILSRKRSSEHLVNCSDIIILKKQEPQ